MGLLEAIERHASLHPDQRFARPRPLCWAYCTVCVSKTLLLVPVWTVYYSIMPRPRKGWSLGETLTLRFMRNMNEMSENAGLAHSVRDPTKAPKRRLKETRFEWKQALPAELRQGVVKDPDVPFLDRVGTYVWEKHVDLASPLDSAPSEGLHAIYFHGGGYCHFSAHEKSQTSKIPRRLIKSCKFSSIHAVEYRLLPGGPFPAALQDGLSVYAHLVNVDKINPEHIVLLGDSAGGNIVLAMARWLRDTKVLPQAGGLLLFSPWCDPSKSYPCCATHHVARKNAHTDYLTDIPAPRRFLCRTFLGNKEREYISDSYISPASELGTHGRFTGFPSTHVAYSDAERLEDEIDMLVAGLVRDQVPVSVDKYTDAPHDVMMIMYWGQRTLEAIEKNVQRWTEQLWKEKSQVTSLTITDEGSNSSKATDIDTLAHVQ